MTLSLADHRTDLSGFAPLHPVLPHVVVYSKPACPHCDRLKNKLMEKKIAPVGVDMAEQPEILAAVQRLGAASAPVALVHNVFEQAVWFAGALPDQIKHVVAGHAERMAFVLSQADLSQEDLFAALEPAAHSTGRSSCLGAEDFVDLAAGLMPPLRLGAGPLQPDQLRSDRSLVPPVRSDLDGAEALSSL